MCLNLFFRDKRGSVYKDTHTHTHTHTTVEVNCIANRPKILYGVVSNATLQNTSTLNTQEMSINLKASTTDRSVSY